MSKLPLLLHCVLVMAIPQAIVQAESMRTGSLSFGWATESIVPNRPVAIGGQYHTRISGVVHDPITVTALALETRDDRGVIDQTVWVSCDLVGIRRRTVENVRSLVAKAVPELNTQKIIISATHTHTAPALTDTEEEATDFHPYDFVQSWAYRIPAEQVNVMRPLEFLDFLERQIAAAVARAWESRQPGEFSFALSHASVARNRRAVYFDGNTRMYGDTKDPGFSHTEGTTDDSLDVLTFWREDKLIGMVLTLYCPAQSVESETHLSADFWYDTRSLLREKYSKDLFILPLAGASGDQSPHIQVAKQSTQRMLGSQQYRQQIAQRIVQAVENVADFCESTKTPNVLLTHHVELVPLPVWKVSDERVAQAAAAVETGISKLDQLSGPDYINWRVQRTMTARYQYQQEDPYYQCEIHALRLNDLALATNPFELFTDYSTRIKARSPAVQTSVVQLTADCPAYLPTERAVQGGGYSARIDDGVVGPEGGRTLVNETSRILKSLWPATN
jgi:hypothetical protein